MMQGNDPLNVIHQHTQENQIISLDRKLVKIYGIKNNKKFDSENLPDDLKMDKKFFLDIVDMNGLFIKYADKSLKEDEEVVLKALNENPFSLEFVDQKFLGDKDLALKIIRKCGVCLKYFTENLKKDREICLEAIKNSSGAIIHVHKDLLSKKEFIKEAIALCPRIIKYCPIDIASDTSFLVELMKKGYKIFFDIPQKVKEDKEIIIQTLINRQIISIPESLLNDLETAKHAINLDPKYYLKFSQDIQENEEICYLVVSKDGSYIYKIPSIYSEKKHFVRKAIETFQIYPSSKFWDPELIYDLIKSDFKRYYQFYSSNFFPETKKLKLRLIRDKVEIGMNDLREFIGNDYDLLYEYIKYNPETTPSIPNFTEIPIEMKNKLAKEFGYLFRFLTYDMETVIEAIKINFEAFYRLDYTFKSNEDFLKRICFININYLDQTHFINNYKFINEVLEKSQTQRVYRKDFYIIINYFKISKCIHDISFRFV